MPLRSTMASVALVLASSSHAAGADRTDGATGPGAGAVAVAVRPTPCTRPGAVLLPHRYCGWSPSNAACSCWLLNGLARKPSAVP